MAVNPLYTAKAHQGGGKEFPKLPAIVLRGVGAKFQGTVKEVSDSFEMTESFGQGDKKVDRKVTKQVVTYTDVTVINKSVNDDGEVTDVKETFPEANFWLSKPAQFVAIGESLEQVGLDEIPVGKVHRFKRITDGEAKQLKDGSMGSRPHRFLSEFVV